LGELLACALELGSKRSVSPSALVLEGVGVENVDGGENGDQTDEQYAGEELEEGASGDRPVGTASLPTGRARLPGSRRKRPQAPSFSLTDGRGSCLEGQWSVRPAPSASYGDGSARRSREGRIRGRDSSTAAERFVSLECLSRALDPREIRAPLKPGGSQPCG
jgi:hypothetical protein